MSDDLYNRNAIVITTGCQEYYTKMDLGLNELRSMNSNCLREMMREKESMYTRHLPLHF